MSSRVTELFEAITVQDERAVLNFLGQINFQEPIKGYTPLMQAVEFNNTLKVIQALLASGAKVNPVDFVGNSALHLAAIENRPDVIKVLLEHGADATMKNSEGKTPTDLATSSAAKELLPS